MPRQRAVEPPKKKAVLGRQLEQFPWARLSDDKGDQLELSLLIAGASDDGRAWIVSAKDDSRLPGPFEQDMYVALGQLHNAQIPREKRGEVRTVQTTFRDLASLMSKELGGNTYSAIRGGLERLADVSIRAVKTWKEGDILAEEKRFHLLESVTYRHRRDREDGATGIVIRFAEEVAQSLAEDKIRLLDTTQYFALETPTAKRLYRYLDVKRWRGAEELDVLTLSLKELAEYLPIDRDSPSHIKRTLDPAHERLIADGYLHSAEYQEIPVPKKKRPVVYVRYSFAQNTAVTTSHPPERSLRKSAEDQAEAVRFLVSKILTVLRDERSTAFYVKVVRTLSEEDVNYRLGSVKQAIREGTSLDTARKIFTSSVKKRAKDLGLEL
jgi:hypothetical protein